MKCAIPSTLAVLAGLMLAGCQTPGGANVSPETKAAQSAALRHQQQLEQRLSAHLAAQSAISNQAERLHSDLLEAAKEMRGIKDQANLVSAAAQTNRLALEALQYDIVRQGEELKSLEKKALAESEKVKALQDALSKEQKVRQQEAEALKAEAARLAAEERKKTEEVKEALAREQQLRDKAVAEASGEAGKQAAAEKKKAEELQKALAHEQELRAGEQASLQAREMEIVALRKSLEERDQLLRTQTAAKPAPAGEAVKKETETPAARQVADGNAALRKGQLDEAEKQFKAALIAVPGMMGARIGLAACRYERGDLKAAQQIVTEVLKEDRRNAQALGLLGLVHWRSGELDDAEDVLEDAIKQDKQDSQLRNYLGIVLYERKKFDPAVASLHKAVELDPTNAEARYNLSVVLATGQRPQLEEARLQYDKAVELGSARDEAMEKILGPAKPAAPKS